MKVTAGKVQREHETWIDFTRGAAAFMVVWLHAAAPWLYGYGKVPLAYWQFANILDSIVRMSVPLFFMLTGYLLLSQRMPVAAYLKRRFSRIAVPWLAWSVVYLAWHRFHEGSAMSMGYAARQFMDGTIADHLWFLYTLVGLYLFVPILVRLTDSPDVAGARYFVVLWLAAASLIPFFKTGIEILHGRGMHVALDLTMFGGYSGYLVLGFLVGRIDLTRAACWLAVGAMAAGIASTAAITAFVTARSGVFVEYFYAYLSPNVVVTSAAAFLLLRHVGKLVGAKPALSAAVRGVGGASLGVYLVHPIFLDLIREGALGAGFASLANGTPVAIPLVAGVAYVLSWASVFVVLKVPFLRRIV
jgi:surface polysaccharide O-acyltransferase-like enzyme